MMNSLSTRVLVLPGGAYGWHSPHEGAPVAQWLTGLGYQAEVIQYPLGPAAFPDAPAAVRAAIVRARADGVGRVGVLGFSAGGHLAGYVAFEHGATPDQSPDFAILCYPVVILGEGGHAESTGNFLGTQQQLAASVSLDNLVGDVNPLTFVWHTADDNVVPVAHSLRLAEALARNESAFELHVFPHGDHGLGLAEGLPASAWVSLCEEWLRRTVVGGEKCGPRVGEES